MTELLKAFILVVLAEIGDKTQILIMILATKVSLKTVVLSATLGAIISHGMAIIFGMTMAFIVPPDTIQLFAGILFIALGLMALNITEENKGKTNYKTASFTSLTLSFFLAELGDKTQLTVATLIAETTNIGYTFAGSLLAVIFVYIVSIKLGSRYGDQFSELIGRSLTFAVFTMIGIYKILSSAYVISMGTTFIVLLLLIISLLISFRVLIFKRQLNEVTKSAFLVTARNLKRYQQKMTDEINEMCLNCDVCKEKDCMLGYVKYLLANQDKAEELNINFISNLNSDDFDINTANDLLKLLESYYKDFPEQKETNALLTQVYELINKRYFEKRYSMNASRNMSINH